MKRTCLLVLLLISPAVLLASGTIKGRVFEKQTLTPLIGAHIVVAGTSYGTAADQDGEFSIFDLPAGVFTLKASFVGYASVTIENVRVFNDLTAEVTFELAPEAVQIQAITVVAERPLVNKSATNAMRITTIEDFKNQPVRDVNTILSLQPGIVLQDGNIYIRGGRVDETGYYLEGVSITDPQYGGRGVTIPQDALEEMSVQSAGYEAEYGRANSGIVQHQLRSGGSAFGATLEYITDNLALRGKGQSYGSGKQLGTGWYGYNDLTATTSGPLFEDRFKFFGLFNYTYKGDQHPQPYPGINIGPVRDAASGDSADFRYPPGVLLKNSSELYNGTATVSLDFNPLKLRLSGSYSKTTSFSGGGPNMMFDLDRVPKLEVWDGFASLKATYSITPSTFCELGGGFFSWSEKTSDPALGDDFLSYDDSVANALAGYVWVRKPLEANGRYVFPRMLSILGFAFWAPGTPVAQYLKLQRNTLTMNAALTWQIGKEHAVKFGGDLQRFTIRTYQPFPIGLAALIAQNNSLSDGDPAKLPLEDLMRRWGVNTYGYDLFGNVTDDEGFLGPRHPVFASLYLQDKMEYSDLVINAGVRYDYINTATYALLDPTHPEQAVNPNTYEVNPAGLRKTTPFHGVSPRLGLAFPVSDKTVFHVQFAKLVQQSRLRDVNIGLYSLIDILKYGTTSNPVGFDLRPTRTTQYEIGFAQQLGSFASFDITGYYKDIKDEIVYGLVRTPPGTAFGSYPVYLNGDFATTKGFELSFTMRRLQRFQARAALSFQDARGSGSFPNSNWGVVLGAADTIFTPQYISPLSYNHAVRGNINIDYRFGREDGGPVLEELGVSLLFTFNSGHPYTRMSASSYEYNARLRTPIEPLNDSRTPWVSQIDLRIDKSFHVTEDLSATLSVFVINLLDTKNVENVWMASGSPDDDGYLSNPATGGRLIELYGPQYEQMYRAINLGYARPYGIFDNPYFYGPPRQIRVGVKLEY